RLANPSLPCHPCLDPGSNPQRHVSEASDDARRFALFRYRRCGKWRRTEQRVSPNVPRFSPWDRLPGGACQSTDANDRLPSRSSRVRIRLATLMRRIGPVKRWPPTQGESLFSIRREESGEHLGTLNDERWRDLIRAVGNMMGSDCEPE